MSTSDRGTPPLTDTCDDVLRMAEGLRARAAAAGPGHAEADDIAARLDALARIQALGRRIKGAQ